MLAVHFYSLHKNTFCGEGYLMPNMKIFDLYIKEHHPKAIQLAENKYQIDDSRYITCEEQIHYEDEMK